MLKKIIVSLVIALVVVIGGTVYYLDSLVQRGIETVGSDVLGTTVTVSGVSVSPLAGEASIRGLSIANPEAFTAPNAFELGEIAVSLEIGSLFEEVVEIRSIIIDSPAISYENTVRTDNFRALLANIERREPATQAAGQEPAGKELIIRELHLRNPQLNLITPVASAPITMGDISLENIGTAGSGGASAREVIQLLLARINRAVMEGNLPQVEQYRQRARERLQELEGDARQRLEEAETDARERVDEAVQDLGNRLQNILSPDQ